MNWCIVTSLEILCASQKLLHDHALNKLNENKKGLPLERNVGAAFGQMSPINKTSIKRSLCVGFSQNQLIFMIS